MPNASAGNNISSSAQINAGVIIGSDLANDTITTTQIGTGGVGTDEIADGVIQNSDISASAGIVDTKLATISTAGKVSGAALTSLSSIPAGAGVIPSANLPGGADTFMILKPVLPANAVGTRAMLNTADCYGYSFTLERAMTVNKISFNVTAVGAAGTVRIGVYSYDGQTRHIDVTSASISATGVNSVAVSSVALPTGTYYIMYAIQTGANLTFTSWTDIATALNLSTISSEPLVRGLLTVTAGALPTTFTTTSSGTWQDSANGSVVTRLDN